MFVDASGRLYGGETLDRIANRLRFEGDCWLWTGQIIREGYGRLEVDGRMVLAHRTLYELVVGSVPEGFELDHLCRNRACVNPDHLEVVTHAENMRRGDLWQKRRTRCPEGHAYDLIVRRLDGHTYRACSDCRRRASTESARRRRRRAAA